MNNKTCTATPDLVKANKIFVRMLRPEEFFPTFGWTNREELDEGRYLTGFKS